MRQIWSKKKKTAWDKEGINKLEINFDQDPMTAKWGTISAVAGIITAIVSAGVLIYTVVQYIQISK